MTLEIYTSFLRELEDGANPSYVSIYHAVRNIPYGVTGERSPTAVLKNRIGSCSGKHMLLRDLLEAAGYEAEIITIHTHFSKGIPLVSTFPDDLAQMIHDGDIIDYHHFVRIRIDEEWLNLDATWPDSLGAYGFPVNTNWNGIGHTIIATDTIEEYPAVKNLAEFKQELIAALPTDVREKREKFFDKLTSWMQAELSSVNSKKIE